MRAPQAAGVIHSDFEKGFIRAETARHAPHATPPTPRRPRHVGLRPYPWGSQPLPRRAAASGTQGRSLQHLGPQPLSHLRQVAYDDLVAAGSMKEAKEKGTVRAEGKEYEVKDADVLLFRFN